MAGVAGDEAVLGDGRLADAGRGKDGLPTADEHARSAALRAARTQLERGVLGHQLSPRVIVGSAEQGGHRHVDKIRVAVPSLAIGKGELGAFDDDMDKIGAERVEIAETEPLQQCQLLQQNRPLAPRPAFRHGIAVILEGERRLDRRLPARQVVPSQQPAMTSAGRVEHLLVPAKAVDRLGDKAAVPRPARALDLPLSAAVAGLCEDAAVGRGESGIAEQPSRFRRRTGG